MARITVDIDAVSVGDAIATIQEAARGWDDATKVRFMAEWNSLMANGCMMCDLDGLIATVSDDLRQHAKAYGVTI